MSTKWTQKAVDAFNAKKSCKHTGSLELNSNYLEQKNRKSCNVTGLSGNLMFALGRLKAGKMNKTEAAYAAVLEARKHAGDVLWWEFEPMNLRLADKCFYQVDFLVMVKGGQLECHEVKGYWTDDALVKIKTAAAKFPFRFIALRLVAGDWEIREF